MSELSDNYEKTMAKVFQAIGRSVFMYQSIEIYLKVLLPNLVAEDSDSLKDPFEEMKKLLESKTTLGPLAEKLKKSVECSYPEGFSAYLEQVVENRNELVHKFKRLSFGKLSTVEDCNEASLYLKNRHEFAMPLFNMLREFLGAYVEYLSDDEDELLH